MNTVAEVIAELETRGDPRRVRAFAPHGAPEDLLGVSVADMKVMARKLKAGTNSPVRSMRAATPT